MTVLNPMQPGNTATPFRSPFARSLFILSAFSVALLCGCAVDRNTVAKVHVITLTDGMNPRRDVGVDISDSSTDHILVLLSGSPIRWHISIAENTRLREVLYFAAKKNGQNSVVTGLPTGLVAIDMRLPNPIRRFEVNSSGRIAVSESLNDLQAKLLERYGLQITTFQSGVSQASFMIR